MEILAGCSYEESLNYNGKLIVEQEEGTKPDKVFLNVVTDNGDTSILKNLKPCVKCITYKDEDGSLELSVDSEMRDKVFREVSYENIFGNLDTFTGTELSNIEGVTTLVRLPDGFCNMKVVKDLCEAYPSVRVIGGNLLNIEGVRIGRFDLGKDKGSPVYNGVYDQFLELPLSEIGNLKDVVKKARKKLDKAGSDKTKKSSKEKKVSSKKNDIANSFSSLFGDIVEEDF